MNKKGFTLIEILAVIGILSVIIIVVATKGFGAFNNAKVAISNENEKAIKEGAKVLLVEVKNCDETISDDLFDYFNVTKCEELQDKFDECVDVDIDYLLEKGFVTGSEIDKIKNNYSVNACLNGKVKINYNSKDDTLKETIIVNAKNEKNETKLVEKSLTNPAEEISLESEKLLVSSGDGYYYRGNVDNNYLEFNGMCFRIVRIDNSGNVKLVLAGESSCNDTTSNSGIINNATKFGYKEIRKASLDIFIADYINYSNGLKNQLEYWLKNNFDEEQKEYLKNNDWCLGGNFNNKYDNSGVLLSNNGEYIDSNFYLEYNGKSAWYYLAGKRLNGLGGTNQYVSFNCSSEEDTYNGYVGALTADEVAMAGGKFGVENKSYYLYDNAQNTNYWTLSMMRYNSDNYNYVDGNIYDNSDFVGIVSSGKMTLENVRKTSYFRPVIILNSSVKISSGDGTKTNPYKVIL